MGKAVDQASGITATAGEIENISHSEDASQKAVISSRFRPFSKRFCSGGKRQQNKTTN